MLPTRLRQTPEILRRVKVETGMGYLDAHAWFRAGPLAGLDGTTADRLVREGYVLACFDGVADGSYA